MSTKSSIRSTKSVGSSAGETHASSYSTGSSRRHRRGNATALSEACLSPAVMSADERLTLVRNAVTRLQYVCERQMHMSALDQAGGEIVNECFNNLRQHILTFQANSRRKVSGDVTGPRQLTYMAKKVEELRAQCDLALLESGKGMGNAEAVYEGLQYHHLQDAIKELDEMQTLLSKRPQDMPSRVNTTLLSDLVSFHINEFDAFMEHRVEAFVQELMHEGVFFSSAVCADSSKNTSPTGISSVVLLDVAIGVRPGRNARIVVEHAQKRITKMENRLQAADIVLHESKPKDEAEAARYEAQRREFVVLKERVRHALSELDRLRNQWEGEEQNIFDRATSGAHDLRSLLQTKQIKEAEIIEEAQMLHDQTMHACLPFTAPQYHRRYGETYSQPCQIRFGYHCLSECTDVAPDVVRGVDGPITLFTLSPAFFPMMRQHNIPKAEYETYSYLVPSRAQMWISFSEFPEMVKGARCALRGAHTRLDHFRALEEQKEVGGYFIMRGGERILRSLLMQRCNVPINIQRDKFQTQGPHFSSKAVVLRCKRPSGLTVQNYFFYTKTGEVIFSFARKVVWHVPVVLLLLATNTRSVSMLELLRLLTMGMPAGDHPSRVEALLQHHRQKSYGDLTHFIDLLSVLGRMYCQYHETSNSFRFLPQFAQGARFHHDAWYGLFLLRRHVLPHLNVAVATPDLSPLATPEDLLQWLPLALLEELSSKFDTLIAIVRQLYLFIDGKSSHQGSDVPAYQELFTVSQVLIGVFELCLNKYMKSYSYRLGRHISVGLFRSLCALPAAPLNEAEETMRQLKQFSDFCIHRSRGDPLDLLDRLLITGNLSLDREEDFYCPQTSGWVIMAEHLNFYRFFEQLRCVHRGKNIADMRSSEVRKYPCEAYGFICMVHSPDGEDCGVLNHLSIATIMSNSLTPKSILTEEMNQWVAEALPHLKAYKNQTPVVDQLVGTVPVWLEGHVIGYASPSEAGIAATVLRQRKAVTERALTDANGIVRRKNVSPLQTLEVVYVPPGNPDPCGLYIFYDCGRLMRPVQQITSAKNTQEKLAFPLVYIGTWEQTWLDIASVPSDLVDGVVQLNRTYQYMEQNGSNLISLTSATIPFFEYNCSPRNLFQCGLSKQSAGTQLQSLAWRKEAKLFRMYTPQRYISRTLPMDIYGLDDVNLGVNAVVAILSYTGYDLDDAVILNSTASQRGMLTAGITVAKIITASGNGDKDDVFVFQNVLSTGERFTAQLDANGLPVRRTNPSLESVTFDTDHTHPSLKNNSDVYCCAKRTERKDFFTNQKVYEYTRHQTTKWRYFDKGEDAWVQHVIPLAYNGPDPTVALVVFRIPRPPAVGDKFSSRHGQKGTLPLHIRAHDLPFSSRSGITPDIIINPHAFPSRMTVGMVLEIMTAKVGAIEGRFLDNSAWSTVDDMPRLAEEIGDALVQSGYNRYGREKLIDGISGEEMEADVFMGISGYQRLRHMVNDKWQARARTDAHTFRAVTKTGQPVKGRKRHGGVRVGEMERDGLLSHGISEVVLDRLLHVSDMTKAFICPECGGLLSIYERHATEYSTWKTCRFCGAGSMESSDSIAMVEIPQVLRLWAAELTCVGIRVALKTAEQSSFV